MRVFSHLEAPVGGDWQTSYISQLNEYEIKPLAYEIHVVIITKEVVLLDADEQRDEVPKGKENPNEHYCYDLLGDAQFIFDIPYSENHSNKYTQLQPVQKDKDWGVDKFVFIIVWVRCHKMRIWIIKVSIAFVSLEHRNDYVHFRYKECQDANKSQDWHKDSQLFNDQVIF